MALSPVTKTLMSDVDPKMCHLFFLMPLGSKSHIHFKKWPCYCVEFKHRGHISLSYGGGGQGLERVKINTMS